ncbi:hypothetical protein pdam_00002491 [Pocillopora damicornis]|uniref:G-protein coupled receptors family 1 profile domain-containing protein n=1 Tax=Pocillopora damicornis TaxID=46731 RepID=A0A3M6TS16_POCDA|nr:hypothetical protein pdam_00002491 [Pocillopora damicornis]
MTSFSISSTMSTENFSTTISGTVESQGVEILKSTLYATCGVFGVVGNILTTIILTKIKAKETRVMDFYMINLAIADLGTLLLAFPITAIRERLPNDWPFGEFVCLYFLPLTDIFHGSSVWFITAAAIERYQKIARPSKVNVKLPIALKRAQIVAVSTWVASFVVFSLPLYFVLRYREVSTDGRFWCGSEWPSLGAGLALSKLYFTFMVFVSYVMPLFVISGTFLANQVIGDEAKANFLKCAEQFAIYQKSFATEKPLFKHEALEAMTLAVITKTTDVLSSQKYASHGLEKLSVPT